MAEVPAKMSPAAPKASPIVVKKGGCVTQQIVNWNGRKPLKLLLQHILRPLGNYYLQQICRLTAVDTYYSFVSHPFLLSNSRPLHPLLMTFFVIVKILLAVVATKADILTIMDFIYGILL